MDRFAVQVVHLDQLLVRHKNRARLRVALHLRRLVAHGHARVGAETHREALAHCHRLQLRLRVATHTLVMESESEKDTLERAVRYSYGRCRSNARSVSTRSVQTAEDLREESVVDVERSRAGEQRQRTRVRGAHREERARRKVRRALVREVQCGRRRGGRRCTLGAGRRRHGGERLRGEVEDGDREPVRLAVPADRRRPHDVKARRDTLHRRRCHCLPAPTQAERHIRLERHISHHCCHLH